AILFVAYAFPIAIRRLDYIYPPSKRRRRLRHDRALAITDLCCCRTGHLVVELVGARAIYPFFSRVCPHPRRPQDSRNALLAVPRRPQEARRPRSFHARQAARRRRIRPGDRGRFVEAELARDADS